MSVLLPELFSHCLNDLSLSPKVPLLEEAPKAWLKHLRPLGHELQLFRSATEALLRRVSKQRLSNELNAFLQSWLPESSPENLSKNNRLLLGETEAGWQLMGSAAAWLNDPIWAALLHLPGLRSHWQAQVRATHLEHLQQLLPPAWLLHATPLPPGSVIAGLGITGWERLASTGGDFQVHDATGAITKLSAVEDVSVWQEKLRHAMQTNRPVLTRAAVAPKTWLLADYANEHDQILLSHAWKSDAEGTSQLC